MAERVIEFLVDPKEASGRADKIFAAQFEDVSRARLQRAFDAGAVSFNGVTIDKRFKVKEAGLLRAVLVDASDGRGPSAVDIPLDIIYEDASIVVVNKAAGMVTHPGSGTGEDTLVHALLHHTGGELSQVGAPERPGIVHRLDKETTGLIVVAKNDRAHHKLASAFSERETYKRYRALVFKSPILSSGACRGAIARHPVVRTRMAVSESSTARHAHTDWLVEERFGRLAALMSCVIHTGRTHQIRVHMSDLGHPLLGDVTYGFKANRLKAVRVPRVMLHSTELHVRHPDRDQLMRFEAPLPEDMHTVVAELKSLC